MDEKWRRGVNVEIVIVGGMVAPAPRNPLAPLPCYGLA